ncbi:ATP-dependent DNA helicase srs2 [Friedmanniomyces endolithicus]|uniref:ubiquitinyl hydrolase 1 n=1 Tax=Friedmanniomyces endolithicus TaxID=329885 RepID=A0AAN6FH00_9PEZI|nr:ATP-dependent DNA helicase srs2 [Friedmanniomyces endolithicus]
MGSTKPLQDISRSARANRVPKATGAGVKKVQRKPFRAGPYRAIMERVAARWELFEKAADALHAEKQAKEDGSLKPPKYSRFQPSTTPVETKAAVTKRNYLKELEKLQQQCAGRNIELVLGALPSLENVQDTLTAARQESTDPRMVNAFSFPGKKRALDAPGDDGPATKRAKTGPPAMGRGNAGEKAPAAVHREEKMPFKLNWIDSLRGSGHQKNLRMISGAGGRVEGVASSVGALAKRADGEPDSEPTLEAERLVAKKLAEDQLAAKKKTDEEKKAAELKAAEVKKADEEKEAAEAKAKNEEAARAETVKQRAILEEMGRSQKRSTKRPAEDAIDDSHESKKAKRTNGEPRGLYNHNLACFSNVVLQLLAAALEGKDLTSLFGALKDVETFGVSTLHVNVLNVGTKTKSREMGKMKAALRAAIQRDVGDDAERVRSHLHDVLHRLRDRNASGAVAPFFLQMAFAYGGTGTASGGLSLREEMSGDTEEDCVEFFQKLMNVLCEAEDPTAVDGLRSLFEVITTSTDVCEDGCIVDAGRMSTPEVSISHELFVPETTPVNGKSHDLQTLLANSMMSSTEQVCTECKIGAVSRVKRFATLPEQLVVEIRRASFDRTTDDQTKITTEVVLPLDAGIQLAEQQYDIVAAVMHRGQHTHSGHYTVYRKQGAEWFLMDDQEATKVLPEDVKDNSDNWTGQSAMILLKKRQSRSAFFSTSASSNHSSLTPTRPGPDQELTTSSHHHGSPATKPTGAQATASAGWSSKVTYYGHTNLYHLLAGNRVMREESKTFAPESRAEASQQCHQIDPNAVPIQALCAAVVGHESPLQHAAA